MKNKNKIKMVYSQRSDSQQKLKWVLLSLLIMIGSANFLADAQTAVKSGTITGVVTDETGSNVPGVSILIEGTTTGTTTNFDGKYSIRASANDVLVYSFIGYKKQKIKVGDQTVINLSLISDSQMLEEAVVTAFGKQRKNSVIGSISTVDTKTLKVPSSNLQTAFAGKLAGVISYQKGGDPGVDNNIDFFVRGVSTMGASSKPLILIDGIESSSTDLARLQPDDIATFSIMKDATSTALYGARGANGVMLITTKEGQEGKVKLSIRVENNSSMATQNVQFADPVTYMLMHNEANVTRGLASIYNADKIENTIAGTNPYVYPAVNWQDMLLKNSTNNQRINFNVSGGSKVARYYVGCTYNVDNGILKQSGTSNFNNNIQLNTYQLRSNVNVNITKSTEVILRLGITMDNYNGPIDGGNGLYTKIVQASPVDFPAYYPASSDMTYIHHIMFGNKNYLGNYMENPYADMVDGYKQSTKSTVVSTFEVKQDLNEWIKGLTARGLFSTNRYATTGQSRSYVPYWYNINMPDDYNPIANTYKLTNLNPLTGQEWLNYSQDLPYINTTTYGEAAINYDRTFGKHGISGLLVGYLRNYDVTATSTQISNNTALISTLPTRNMGISGRLAYNYDARYFIEGNFGYNGSERFAANHRFGFFPSIGLGWLVSNEKIWQDYLISAISKLKLKATYGLVGNDNLSNDPAERYFYLSNVTMANSSYAYTFGQNGITQSGVSIDRYANPDISWELSTKTNFGFELELFRALELQLDYFTDNRTNVLMTRSNVPSTLGLVKYDNVKANTGAINSNGVDISLDYKKNFKGGFWITSHNTLTYATNKIAKIDEPDYSATPWLSRVGYNFNQSWGYVAERLFVDDKDILNSPDQKSTFGTVQAGDIKYKDINKDGKIDGNDRVAIGYPTVPELTYGFGVSCGYKGFDFSVFFQGTGRRAFWIDPKATSPFMNSLNSSGTAIAGAYNQLLQAYADNHWSEGDRNPYALWPRLSTTLINNNAQTSTWFMRDGSFMRLKNIEFGYSIPSKILRKIGLESIRIYYSGTNLLTFSKFSLWDPEMGGNGLAYPIQKTHNVGLTVSL